jgi:hypothetical protein
VKALSLTQPWAQVILHHGKRVENRQAWRNCSYRGPILLHAAKGTGSVADFDDMFERMAADGLPVEHWAVRSKYCGDEIWRPHPDLPRGGIVGRCRIDGVIRTDEDFAAYAANVVDAEAQRAWWWGEFALVLADVEAMPFVPWKGALGLFEVPDAAVGL